MDASRFDNLTRTLARTGSRRHALFGLAGLAGGALALLAGETAEAKRHKHKKAHTADSNQARCKDAGRPCAFPTNCCTKVCCNKTCCAKGQVCDVGHCCTPKTCAASPGQCGATLDNGCGGTLSCGCGSGQTCQNGTCGCAPQCAGKTCGADGCGGSCGSCATGQRCDGSGCVCDSTSCPNGCCDGTTCVPFAQQRDTKCGTGGQSCHACGGGQTCVDGTCHATCAAYGASACPTPTTVCGPNIVTCGGNPNCWAMPTTSGCCACSAPPGRSHQTCNSDADCVFRAQCDLGLGRCNGDEGLPCTSNSDCASLATCRDGECGGPICTTDADCTAALGPGTVCISGEALPCTAGGANICWTLCTGT